MFLYQDPRSRSCTPPWELLPACRAPAHHAARAHLASSPKYCHRPDTSPGVTVRLPGPTCLTSPPHLFSSLPIRTLSPQGAPNADQLLRLLLTNVFGLCLFTLVQFVLSLCKALWMVRKSLSRLLFEDFKKVPVGGTW